MSGHKYSDTVNEFRRISEACGLTLIPDGNKLTAIDKNGIQISSIFIWKNDDYLHDDSVHETLLNGLKSYQKRHKT
jgi:hypothetical protein